MRQGSAGCSVSCQMAPCIYGFNRTSDVEAEAANKKGETNTRR